ncbi:hypothetical protein [Methylobacterium sp. Leaf118]|uniref:hypothetical protein n=1 Tax=Methylobacterium sp. Leaf118 TaxID=2876562 RepID=UPI001E29F95D|nr:hypothetical protein [Methylobacterium sp. Leaf118]
MRAALFGLAVALAGLGAAAPASALPIPGAVPGLAGAPDGLVQPARVVRRTVIRGPRCDTVITKRRGPFGRTTVVRKRRCF